ncbi:MAG: glycosyltransferase family 39 protein, partial [Patescibacteria group bacterium]|nr:glycosyltransferase family 39 protein [Patescibacteria group bacterium]
MKIENFLTMKKHDFLLKITKEVKNCPLVYLCFLIILFLSVFLRLFRLNQLLGFWYDQGRDALIIWDLLHYHKFFLIGPVTGIEGIFLGPFYYYLLAPLYFLGNGSPVFATAGLCWLTVGAIFLIYLLTAKIYNRETGLLAVLLYGLSSGLVIFSRWLANPNPLPFFTLLVLLSLYQFMQGKKWYLVIALFLIGLSLQLEAASAFWFLPATFLFLIWQRKKLSLSLLFFSGSAFLVTLLPQIVFDLRHQGILRQAFHKFLVADKSFNGGLSTIEETFLEGVKRRALIYYGVFVGKLFSRPESFKVISLALFSANLILFRKKIFNEGGKLLGLWFSVPLVGFLFYKGNHGYIWDYYFTGFIPAFIILLAAGIVFLAKRKWFFQVILGIYLMLFAFINLQDLRNYYQAGIGIALRAQLRGIDWIYKEAGKEEFNIDAYVPPQIYYSYSYLFRWYGQEKYGREPETKLVKNLYTLFEPDGEHPQFLKAG